jgi:hypothetical protein
VELLYAEKPRMRARLGLGEEEFKGILLPVGVLLKISNIVEDAQTWYLLKPKKGDDKPQHSKSLNEKVTWNEEGSAAI